MAAANAFVNGFMGGMGAMNQMIDSKARREHYAWQKEMTMQDRAIAAEERMFVNEERQRAEALRELSAVGHWYNNATAENKKLMEKTVFDTWRNNPAMAAYTDNNNPNERREFSHLKPAFDASGQQIGYTPVANIYDITGDKEKLIRTGDFTENGPKGGRPLYISNEDLLSAMAGPDMTDTRLALQTQMIRLGGEIPEVSEQWGKEYVSHGNLLSRSNKGNVKRLGAVKTGKNGSDSGSGSGGGTWKNYQTRTVPDPAFPDDPSKTLTEMVQYKDNGDGTVSVRGMVDTGGGKMKIEEYGVSYFNQPDNAQPVSGMDAMFGPSGENTDSNTEPAPEVVKPAPKSENEPKEKPVAEQVATLPPPDPVAMGGRGAYGVIAGDAAERARQRHKAQLQWNQAMKELQKNKPIRGRPTNYAQGMSAIRPGGLQ